MNSQLKKALWLLFRLAVSVLLLGILFREPDLAARLGARLQDMTRHLPWVLAGLGCVVVTTLLAALRWWLVLRPHVPEAGPGFVLRTSLVAWFFSVTTLGALGGDAWRVLEVRRRFPGHGISGGVSVLLDHAAGLVAMILFSIATCTIALLAWGQDEGVRSLVWQLVLTLVIITVLMGMAIGSLSQPFLRRFGQHTPKPCKPFVDRASQHLVALAGHWRALFQSVLVSLALLTSHFLTFYCGLRAVGGMSEVLPLFLAMPLVDLAASMPVSVAGLGVREKTFESLMHALTGMPVDVGVSASLAGWLFTLAIGVVGGLLFAFDRRVPADPAP